MTGFSLPSRRSEPEWHISPTSVALTGASRPSLPAGERMQKVIYTLSISSLAGREEAKVIHTLYFLSRWERI
jgi:hypothetical protein